MDRRAVQDWLPDNVKKASIKKASTSIPEGSIQSSHLVSSHRLHSLLDQNLNKPYFHACIMHFTGHLSAASALLALASASPLERRDIKKEFTIEQSVPKPFIQSGPAAVLSTYNKFNVPAPEDVVTAAAANDGTVTAVPTNFDSQYLTPVSVGGQTVNLDFDTGSADL